MKQKELTIPEIGLIAATRVMLGVGIGLLLGGKLNDDQRRSAGWTLVAVGVVSTIPIAANLLGKNFREARHIEAAERLEEATV